MSGLISAILALLIFGGLSIPLICAATGDDDHEDT